MPLVPDKNEIIFKETDVTSGTIPIFDAFNLTLYKKQGNPQRGVLEMQMIVQLQFVNGTSQMPETRGQALIWTQAEKHQFANDYKRIITQIWDEKHRITTMSTAVEVNDVGFITNITTLIDGTHITEHYEIEVIKTDRHMDQPFVKPFIGVSTIDSMSIEPGPSPGLREQIAATHEFGHMIGLRDE